MYRTDYEKVLLCMRARVSEPCRERGGQSGGGDKLELEFDFEFIRLIGP